MAKAILAPRFVLVPPPMAVTAQRDLGLLANTERFDRLATGAFCATLAPKFVPPRTRATP